MTNDRKAQYCGQESAVELVKYILFEQYFCEQSGKVHIKYVKGTVKV